MSAYAVVTAEIVLSVPHRIGREQNGVVYIALMAKFFQIVGRGLSPCHSLFALPFGSLIIEVFI